MRKCTGCTGYFYISLLQFQNNIIKLGLNVQNIPCIPCRQYNGGQI